MLLYYNYYMTSRFWERSHKPDHSDKWSTSPNNRLVPSSFAKNPKNRIWIVTGWEVLERPPSRPITMAPVTTRRDWNFNRPAWSRVSQPPSTAFLSTSFASPQRSCPTLPGRSVKTSLQLLLTEWVNFSRLQDETHAVPKRKHTFSYDVCAEWP